MSSQNEFSARLSPAQLDRLESRWLQLQGLTSADLTRYSPLELFAHRAAYRLLQHCNRQLSDEEKVVLKNFRITKSQPLVVLQIAKKHRRKEYQARRKVRAMMRSANKGSV